MHTNDLVKVFTYFGWSDDEYSATKPWRLDGWLWATQGHVLVAMRDHGEEAVDTPEKRRVASPYLTSVPETVTPTTLAALREFAGPVVVEPDACDECAGTGRDFTSEPVTCEHCERETRAECDECGGSGKAGLEMRTGKIAGVFINRALLAFGLSLVSGDDAVTIGTLQGVKSKHRALLVDGGEWRVVLMERTAPAFYEPDQPVPEFEARVTGR